MLELSNLLALTSSLILAFSQTTRLLQEVEEYLLSKRIQVITKGLYITSLTQFLLTTELKSMEVLFLTLTTNQISLKITLLSITLQHLA